MAKKLADAGQVVRGLTFWQGSVNGVIASEEEARWPEPGPFLEFRDEGNPTPGNADRPYVQVLSDDMTAGVPAVLPDGVLEVTGRGFATGRGAPLRIRVDGRLLARRVGVSGRDGSFRARIRLSRLRLLHGLHTLSVEQRAGQETLRGAMVHGPQTKSEMTAKSSARSATARAV